MFPTGCFERFENDIIRRYDDYGQDEYVTFGILIADPRQTDAREYIYNYLDTFNRESKNYFDFFIPGYTEHKWPKDAQRININVNDKEYYFSINLFDDFLEKLESIFHIEYTFNPMLILMSMKLGQKHTAQYIVIELDNEDKHDIRRSGMLFKKIFKFAKSNPHLENLQHMFEVTYIKGNWLGHILRILKQDQLIEVKNMVDNIKKYRIK